MLKILNNNTIDREKYLECLDNSGHNSLYAAPWYLDITSPRWKVLVLESENEYEMVMPLSENRKMGIRMLSQPIITQQLGFFSTNCTQSKIEEIISLIDKTYSYINYQLSSRNNQVIQGIKKLPDSVRIKERKNYLLDLNNPYTTLKSSYTSNHKRNIRKALKNNIIISENNQVSALIDIFKQNQQKKIKEVRGKHYTIIKKLYASAEKRNIGNVYIAKDNGKIIAGIFTIKSQNRIHYIFGATTPEARESGAMHLVFDQLIQNYAEQPLLLDFEGSDNDGIARFFKGFGAEPEYYPVLVKEKMPVWYSLLLKIKKWLYSLKKTA